MEDIRYRAALGNIVSEIDRRCHELVHPLPDDHDKALKHFGAMQRILERACFAIVNLDTGSGKLEDLEAVQEFINQERIREYEDQKAEGEGETT